MINLILKVVIFAAAFGFVESAVVFYLRHLSGVGFTPPHIDRNEILFLAPGITFLEPKTVVKAIADTAILNIERMREVVTLIMLASVAAISGRKFAEKIAFFFLVFGIWDIFYYIFLRLTIKWPVSLTDLDIFFLLPTPLVGPVFVPIVISLIFIVGSLSFLLRKGEK